MRLMAWHMPTTHSTVTSAAQSGDSEISPTGGKRNSRMLTPAKLMMLPASTVPAVLAGAEISRTSSMPPTR